MDDMERADRIVALVDEYTETLITAEELLRSIASVLSFDEVDENPA